MPIRQQLRAILVELGRGAAFADDQDIIASGVIGSMSLVELITCLEDTYGFEVQQRDIFDGHLRSLDRLVAYVEGRR